METIYDATTSPSPESATWDGLSLADEAALNPRYEILALVGRGGMGRVFRARHRALDMQVALKVTLVGTSTERFLREAQILAKIRSPYVVLVHDYQVLPSGAPMLVMDWVEGDLHKMLKQQGGPLPEERVLLWMRQACEGMLAAARRDVIHRDLKPSNILVDAQGTALVADFGLARGPLGPSDLSHTGSVMGTPHYMAPEQAENPKGVDTRADIYSFGATFYHLLTGRTAFDGETAFTVMFKHKTEPLPSPQACNPALSARTSELLERCMAKSANDRFASFGEILKHLQPEVATVSPWDSTEDRELDTYLEKYRSRRDRYLAGRRNLTPEGDRYEFPSGAVLIIRSGNIVHEEVDAIVSSDDDYLTMGGGVHGVSGAIYRAAGPSIREETKRYVPVRQGRAVVTSAGHMKARFVFHGITLGARQYAPSRDIICEILASCLGHADTLFVKSMALPLLGTGVGGFSPAVCLDTMFRYFALALHRGVTSVREVRIILFA